jgi:hypothetical protein
MTTREQYGKLLLPELDAPITHGNLLALISWMHAEGSIARFNPFATTQDMPGATIFNYASVKNYPSLESGVEATAKTLLYGANRNLYGYLPILKSLRNDRQPKRTLGAVEKSEWGTGGLAKRVLPYAKRDYRLYADKPVTG